MSARLNTVDNAGLTRQGQHQRAVISTRRVCSWGTGLFLAKYEGYERMQIEDEQH